jgi:hypothetical protein
MIGEAKSRICADCEPRSELVDGKWRLRQQPQTNYRLEFGAYIRWLTAQPKGSIVGDVTITDQCAIHNWLESLGISCYVYVDSIMGIQNLLSQDLPEEFVAVQHEMYHELDLDLQEAENCLISREAALLCAYRVLLGDQTLAGLVAS